jgi:acetoin utilization deacetylase AcuC-like enzyme
MPTGFAYDARFLAHDTRRGHPERPERATAIMRYLDNARWMQELQRCTPVAADPTIVEMVHTSTYIRRAAAACASGQPYLDSMDVAISAQSYEVALLAAGAPLVLADALIAGTIDNGFALVRPPGHHAESGMALGFCLFNNIAILARYLQREHGLNKIAIVDWDVHHGNGTQHTFESDPSVMYISTHQYPFYPGSGAASENGVGRGAGTTLNCPMPAGATDTDYERVFSRQVIPALDRFAPEAILISAGFDAHRDDPLAEIDLSTDAFAWMSRSILEAADRHCGGRVISLLEGGYNLQRIGECVAVHVDELRRTARRADQT